MQKLAQAMGWPHNVALGKDGAVYVSEVHTGMRVQKFVKKK